MNCEIKQLYIFRLFRVDQIDQLARSYVQHVLLIQIFAAPRRAYVDVQRPVSVHSGADHTLPAEESPVPAPSPSGGDGGRAHGIPGGGAERADAPGHDLRIFTQRSRESARLHPQLLPGNVLFFFKNSFWRTSVLFVGPLIPRFWTSDDVYRGSPHLDGMDSSNSPLVQHLLTSW